MFLVYRIANITFNNSIKFAFLRNSLRNFANNLKPTNHAIHINTNVIKDVILYKYENPRFFRILNIFAICQFGLMSYLSVFAFTTLRDVPVSPSPDAPWWHKINLGDNKYRNTIAISAFIIGYGILSISWLYTLRSVRYLILRKGGEKVTFVMYSPFGANRMMTVELKNISSQEMRRNARSQLPIKVQNHLLYYILDMTGEFKNATLFDYTAGLKRTFQ